MILEIPDHLIALLAQQVSERMSSSLGKKWLTRNEAAERLCCKPATIDKLARLGELTKYKPLKTPLFSVEEIDEYVTNRRET